VICAFAEHPEQLGANTIGAKVTIPSSIHVWSARAYTEMQTRSSARYNPQCGRQEPCGRPGLCYYPSTAALSRGSLKRIIGIDIVACLTAGHLALLAPPPYVYSQPTIVKSAPKPTTQGTIRIQHDESSPILRQPRHPRRRRPQTRTERKRSPH
jgi:hypothetical protein